jgi:phytoene dehydrogenase-like protein
MSTPYDLIVIGAGHNGLVAATLAAKRGRKVLVVEKRPTVGGLCAGEEFHPGFKHAGIHHDTSGLRASVVEELELVKHGLKLRADEAPVFAPEEKGRGLLVWKSPRRMAEELAPRSQKDLKAYEQYRATVERFAPVLRKVFDDFPADVTSMSVSSLWELMKKAVSLRMLGKADMMEVLRVAPMCVADWLNEFFEDDLLKACLAGPAVYNTYCGPWSPGSVLNQLIAECFAARPVEGGPQALVKALMTAAEAAGVEIRTNAAVTRVDVVDGKVRGVTLEGGTQLAAAKVGAAVDPKTLFLELVEPGSTTMQFQSNVQNIRARGTAAKVHLAVRSYPEWRERPSLQAEYVRTGEVFDQMERAFDAVKYRKISDEPILDIYVPTLEAPELAPPGQHVLSILVSFAPYQLDGGWTEERRQELYDKVVAQLEKYAPGIGSTIVGKELLSPKDLEERYGLWGGHLHHGEHAADQLLMRPTPECASYATPVAGLFLVGSGAHPGGGVTGAPGAFAARAMFG